MNFQKNNKYFTISVYAVVSTLVTLGIVIALINVKSIWGGLAKIIGKTIILLKPLLIGIVIAYLLDPLVEFFNKKCKNSPLGSFGKKKKDLSRTLGTLFAGLTIIAFIGLFALIITLNVNDVLASNKVNGLMANISRYIDYFQEMIGNVMQTIQNLDLPIANTKIIGQIYTATNQFTSGLTQKLIGFVSSLGSNAINIGLGIVVAFYLVQDKPNLLREWNRFLEVIFPKNFTKGLRSIGRDIDYVFSGYIRGQLLDALIVGALTSLALVLIGLDFAVIIGVIAGIFNIIPYFGPVVGFVLAGIIGSIGPQPQKAIYAMIAVLAIQQVDGWYIAPKVVGNSMKLHPVVVLLAIVIGGELFGLAGILLGVPVAAFIRVLMNKYMGNIFE